MRKRKTSTADREGEKILSDLSAGLIDREDARNQLMDLGFTREVANLLIAAQVGDDNIGLDLTEREMR